MASSARGRRGTRRPPRSTPQRDRGESLAGRVVEVDVGPVAHGGHCVARHEGRVLFVRHAIPGERVVAVVTEGRESDRFLRADAVEVLEASPHRVEQPCPWARPGLCGGCDWQHVELAHQRRLKAAVVEEQLRRLAGLDRTVEVEDVPGDDGGLGWRTRVQYAVDEGGRPGLRRHRSHEVVPIDWCRIASPAVRELAVPERRYDAATAVETVVSTGTGESLVVPVPPGPRREDVVHEVAAGRRWRVSGGGFWQVHPGAADALVGAVLSGLEPREGESALDLFCGAGLFAGAIAARVGQGGRVVGIEGDRGGVADARHNLRDMPWVRVHRGDVAGALRGLALSATDLVVLDPPRAGAGRDVVDTVSGLGPRAVAYVACDPAALARDLAYFAERGYALADLRAFDLFPMTAHVECVAVLEPAR